MSLDEPRASWDKYLGLRAPHLRLTPMVSVVEESWERSSGSSAQTKDNYNSQRWRSFKRLSFDQSAMAEVDAEVGIKYESLLCHFIVVLWGLAADYRERIDEFDGFEFEVEVC
ncbi:hypothetical protein ACFX1Z_023325 [Malus domestica]